MNTVAAPDTAALIPLNELADYLPRRKGRPINYKTLHRWTSDGVSDGTGGRIRLETVLIGGGRYTSPAALGRFIAARNEPTLTPATSTTNRQVRRSRALLLRHGIIEPASDATQTKGDSDGH